MLRTSVLETAPMSEVSFGEVHVSILFRDMEHSQTYVMALNERMLDDLKPPPDMETERLRAPQS